jgi:hypothetical protein
MSQSAWPRLWRDERLTSLSCIPLRRMVDAQPHCVRSGQSTPRQTPFGQPCIEPGCEDITLQLVSYTWTYFQHTMRDLYVHFINLARCLQRWFRELCRRLLSAGA